MQLTRTLGAALLLALVTASSALAADVNIASWNVMRLGHGDQKSFPALASVISEFDFIALQEVMTEEGLDRLEVAVEKTTGESWAVQASHRIGRGSYKERYAFLWRESAIEYVDGAVVFLDTTDRYSREPYSARFRVRADGTEFVAATVHIFYGKSKQDREPEILALRHYWEWLSESYPDTPTVLLMGDFNMRPDESAWSALSAIARPLLASGGSTLSSIDGRYANLYDNIWVPRTLRLPIVSAGVFRYPTALGWTHSKARKHVSDHAPVYVVLETKEQ